MSLIFSVLPKCYNLVKICPRTNIPLLGGLPLPFSGLITRNEKKHSGDSIEVLHSAYRIPRESYISVIHNS